MAINVDATSAGTSGLVASITWNHVQKGNLIVVAVTCSSGTDSTTGVTAGGVALTQIGTNAVNGSSSTATLWYLLNPPRGTISIVASMSGTVFCGALAVSAGGVLALDSNNKVNAGSGAATCSTTAVSGENLLVGLASINHTGGAIAIVLPGVQQQQVTGGSINIQCLATTLGQGSGSVSQSWTDSGSSPTYCYKLASFSAAPVVGENFKFASSNSQAGMSVTEKIR